jgi:hypothetical protein
MLCFIDIETLATTDPAVIADFESKVKAPATYKKPESIAEWMKENKESAVKEMVSKTSFSGLHGTIACICYAFDDGKVFAVDCRNGEKKMIEDFYSHVFDITSSERHGGVAEGKATFVGHNIVGFDLPFLKHRSIILSVKPPRVVREAFAAKPWGSEVADTMILWSSDKEKRASMDSLCKALGLDGKGNFDGSMVADTWPTDPEKVISYCIEDVERTRQIYNRITFNF